MGAQKDTMVLFAERDIRQFFSEYDGWKITPETVAQSAGNFYRIARYNGRGYEVAFVGVSFGPSPDKATVAVLESLTDGRVQRVKKFLLAPQEADTKEIPPAIHVLPMTAFAFGGDKLVWLTKKKYSKKFSPEPTVAA
jgi:hypothetical protein